MDVIDSHTHVISPDTERYPHARSAGTSPTGPRPGRSTIDGLVAAMDEAGIAKAVVVQASTVYGHDSRYVVEAVRAHPGRFVGVFSVDAVAADAVDQIKRWMDQGLAGIRLFTTGSTMPGQADWLGDRRSWPAWAYAEAQGIPVCLQMTMDGIPMLRGLLERFPEAKGAAGPLRPARSGRRPALRPAQALFDLAAFPGVHLKLTNRTLAAAGAGGVDPHRLHPAGGRRASAPTASCGGRISRPPRARLAALLDEARGAVAELPEADRAADLRRLGRGALSRAVAEEPRHG